MSGIHTIRSRRQRPAGFSMIEMLAAMTVLSIMVLIIGRLMNASTNTWSAGSARMQQATNARAALDFMAKEIGGAMNDTVVGLAVENGTRADLISSMSDSIVFNTLTQKADATHREAQQITYFLQQDAFNAKRYVLARGRRELKTEVDAYSAIPSLTVPTARTVADDILIDNAAAFMVRAYTWDTADKKLVYQPNYTTTLATTNNPLAAIELIVGVLGDEDARTQDTIGKIATADRRAVVRWFSTMVHLRHAQSYIY